MTSSQTNQYINDIWKLYYTTQRPEDQPPKINFTILRKSAVTGLFQIILKLAQSSMKYFL